MLKAELWGERLRTKEIVDLVVKTAAEKKAQNILVIDVREYLVITDFFVILSGTNTRQTKRIAQVIEEKLKEENIKSLGVEGKTQGKWILLDYGDLVVHIFTPETRDYYELERLFKGSLL